MSLKFTNVNTYMRMCIDSYIDQKVFDEMYTYYMNQENRDRKPNFAAIASVQIQSLVSFIIHYANSLEAYANLLGDYIFPEGYFEKYLERLPLLDKLSALIEIKYKIKINKGENVFQNINLMIKERNDLMHDKGKIINEKSEAIKIHEKRNIDINEDKVLSSLLDFNEYMSRIGCELHFLFELNKISIEKWLGKRKKFYQIKGNMTYVNCFFPDKHEYIMMVRRHTGFEPRIDKIDEKEKVIFG